MSICLLEKGNYLESIEYSKKVLSIDNQNSEVWVYLAEAYVNLDMAEDALMAYLESLKIDKDQPDTLVAVGNLYLDNENYEKALEYLLAALKLDKETEGLSIFLSICYCKMGEYNIAKPYITDAIEKDPKALQILFEVCPEAESFFIDLKPKE